MSTIHTALTGKSDSLIDAVRDSHWKEPVSSGERHPNLVESSFEGWVSVHEGEGFKQFKELMNLLESELQRQREHPETMDTIHPDYMRMVVHQMD